MKAPRKYAGGPPDTKRDARVKLFVGRKLVFRLTLTKASGLLRLSAAPKRLIRTVVANLVQADASGTGGVCLSDTLRAMPSVLDTVRAVIMRSTPLTDDEREAFVAYSAQLSRHLDAVEEALQAAGQDTSHVTSLRHLLDALPGVMV